MRYRARLLWVDGGEQHCPTVGDDALRAGYLLRYASDAQQARAILCSGTRFDAVVVSTSCFEEVQHALISFLPDAALVVSASGMDELQRAGILDRSCYYLSKPWFAESSLSVLESALLRDRVDPACPVGHHGEFTFRTLEEVTVLTDQLAILSGCAGQRELAVGLAELLINAVEHGNLGFGYEEKAQLKRAGLWEQAVVARLEDPRFSSLYARLEVYRVADELVITIYDNGRGFDWRPFVEIDMQRLHEPNGRGIAMAHQAGFRSIEFLGNGNRVRVCLPCQRPADDQP